ncbi:HAMP domain-containing protein [Sorangium cellulosum]|uniref:Histidine kinase n=1 Tax=Sorangium cellulosum TaxID=56 RepID=A0A150QLN3_SORCE|nr:HAMP domain-containing protein [Sorangium cellulosum]KYF68905.1 histidine kinase [Sorangium cellulosum]
MLDSAAVHPPSTPHRERARRGGVPVGIGVKLAAATVAVLTSVTILVAHEVIEKTRDDLVSAKANAASMMADLLSAALTAPLDFGDRDAAQSDLDELRSNRALIGAVAWGSDPEPVARVGQPPEGLSAFTARGAENQVLEREIRVARPVLRDDGRRLGTVVLVLSLEPENAAFAAARRDILEFAGIVGAMTAFLLLGFARWQIVRPLSRLVHAARRLGEGDRTVRVNVGTNDELGRLADVFNAMSAAILEREGKLEMATKSLRELFDTMREAIVAFGPDGRLGSEVSRRARQIFGERAEAGHHVAELLYSGGPLCVETQALRQWIDAAFDAEIDVFPEIAELAPREAWIERAPGDRRFLRLEFCPVVSGPKIARIMLLATDETELRRLEESVKTKDEEHARQIAAMRRLIAGGGQVFVRFIEVSRERVARCSEILQGGDRLSPADIDELLQLLHTMKGEARSFDLERLADEVMTLEGELAVVQARARSETGISVEGSSASWRSRLKRVAEELTRAQETFVDASPVGRVILDQITVRRTDVARLGELIGGQGGEAAELVRRLGARPFGEVLASLAERVPRWAEQESKRACLEVDGREIPIPPDLARVLPGVLIHLVRNAIAHGVERPDARVRLGKPEIGVIRATCIEDQPLPTIVVEDDGQGIDFDALAASAGVDPSDLRETRELLFAPGVSTKGDVSDLAGRGVGLSAVRADLLSVGWLIEVDASRRTGTAFVIRPRTQAVPRRNGE